MRAPTQLAPSARAPYAYWLCQLLGWGSFGFSLAYSGIFYMSVSAVRATLEVAFMCGVALLLTHLLRRFARRHAWAALRVRALWPRGIAASILMGSVLATVMSFTSIAGFWDPRSVNDPVLLQAIPWWLRYVDPWLLRALNWSFVFFIWVALYFGITSLLDRRTAQLQQAELIGALQRSELRVLKSQLNQHFLFNSLNSIRALIADDPSGAQTAVTQLARILRYTLGSAQDELVTLERELEMVEDYLGIESLRLGERLRIERDIAPDATGIRIPVMLLQTVVENAIKHGIAELPAGGVLRVRAALEGDVLLLEVANPRPAKAPRSTGEGLGLRNAMQRLSLLFGSRASLELDLSRDDLAIARVRVPQTA